MANKKVSRRQPSAIQRFIRETVGELRKVSWPTRQEALKLTQIVIIVMVVMGAILGTLDIVFTKFFALFLG